ncbi:MAG: FAD-binding protein, partial [Acidobacteriota bacterium]
RYGNLFEMYERITGEDPYRVPMRIFPAPHYTMGGLWVDYNLSSNVSGLYVIGEANFSDHGANRLGASALMQGLADGYFVLPATICDYLSEFLGESVDDQHPAFREAQQQVRETTEQLLSIGGSRTVDDFHRELGKLCWEHCGMERSAGGLQKALELIPALRDEFWHDVTVPGNNEDINQSLEKAGRLVDFFELAELMCHDALARDESCGTHFRIEHQTAEGEALRNDEQYAFVSAWEYTGKGHAPRLHKEELTFESVELAQRSYK